MKFFFVSTQHLERRIWFKDAQDFKSGMNYVAVAAAVTSVNILAFILMSNHVHFLLQSSEECAEKYINLFKTLYGRYYRKKYGGEKLLKHNGVDIQEISSSGECLERTIAYILQNSVAARVCLYCSDYTWGSGACYFSMRTIPAVKICEMSARARNKLLKSKVEVPGNWLVCNDGYILPESYICKSFVESLFRSPSRMDYFLKNSSKARRTIEQNAPSFRDQVISEAARDLAFSLFHKQFKAMSDEEKSDYIKGLRWRFSADINQICRVLEISYEEASKLIDAV